MTDVPASTPLAALRKSLALLAVCGAIGGGAAAVTRLLVPEEYRATATLLVAEPRIGSPGGSVDFNLTPIRSYTALLSSPVLAEACAGPLGTIGARVKVRMPEYTRLLELSYDGKDAEKAAAFVNCVAQKAVDENHRLNAELTLRTRDLVGLALESARTGTEKLGTELGSLRASSLIELKRAELRAQLSVVEKGQDEQRRLRLQLLEGAARRGRLGELSAGHPGTRRMQSFLASEPADAVARGSSGTAGTAGSPVIREEADPTRDFADKELVSASASEASAKAALQESQRIEAAAARRAEELERQIVSAEEQLGVLRRRVDGAAAAQLELEKRSSLSALEAAGKAFELVVLAPAAPSTSASTRLPLALSVLLGAALATGLTALLVLTR